MNWGSNGREQRLHHLALLFERLVAQIFFSFAEQIEEDDGRGSFLRQELYA
jgi:hypothetical protein